MSDWIFFDLDGTLIDHHSAANKAALLILENVLGLQMLSSEELLQRWHAVSEACFKRHLNNELTFTEQRRARLRHFRPELSNEECDEIFALYALEYEQNCIAYADVPEALFRLRARYRFGIITNGDSLQQRRKIKQLGLEGNFEIILISGEVGVSKPDPKIFTRAKELSAAGSEKLIYIGDQLDTDAEAATNAGMIGIWLNRNSLQRSNLTPTIHSLLELCTLECQAPAHD